MLSSTLRKTGAHALIYGIGMSFTAISGILLVPLYTRFLTPTDYGIYSLLNIVSSLLLFLYDFGMINAIFRWYFQYAPEEVAMRRKVINTAAVFLLVIASVFTLVLSIGSQSIARMVFNSPDLAALVRLMLFSVMLQSMTWVPLSLLRIRGRVLTFLAVTVATMVILITANYLFLFANNGLYGVYGSSIVTYIFMVAALFVITRQEYSVEFSARELKGMLRFGLPYLPVLFFSWMIDFSDRYLLSQLSTLQEVGLYSVGYRVGQVMYMVEKAFLVAWVPLMLSVYQQHKDSAPKIFGGVFTYFASFIMLLGLAISVFSPEIIKIFTSKAYYDASIVVPWVALAYLLSGIYIYMLSGFIIAKNVLYQPVILSVSAVINIALNILLIPRMGMMGAAYSTVVSYLIVAAATTYLAQKLYPIDIEGFRLLKAGVIVIAAYFASLLIKVPNLSISIMLKAALVSSLVVVLYFAGFFSQQELRVIKGALSRWRAINNA